MVPVFFFLYSYLIPFLFLLASYRGFVLTPTERKRRTQGEDAYVEGKCMATDLRAWLAMHVRDDHERVPQGLASGPGAVY